MRAVVTGGRRAKTRDRLLDAALDLFVEQGFGGTTITEVERRVGLAAGTGSFYRHFSSKEELLQTAVSREVERVHQEMAADAALSEGQPEERAATYRRTLRDVRRFDRLFRLMATEGDRFPEVRAAIAEALEDLERRMPWAENVAQVVVVAALGGYHLFSLLQGRPFEDVEEDVFIATLVELMGVPPDSEEHRDPVLRGDSEGVGVSESAE